MQDGRMGGGRNGVVEGEGERGGRATRLTRIGETERFTNDRSFQRGGRNPFLPFQVNRLRA